MAVVREREGQNHPLGIGCLMDKTVAVDGCYVGVVTRVAIEQYEHYGPIYMQLKVAMTNATMENVMEYEYIQDVMGGAENAPSENHLQ